MSNNKITTDFKKTTVNSNNNIFLSGGGSIIFFKWRWIGSSNMKKQTMKMRGCGFDDDDPYVDADANEDVDANTKHYITLLDLTTPF